MVIICVCEIGWIINFFRKFELIGKFWVICFVFFLIFMFDCVNKKNSIKNYLEIKFLLILY